MPAAWGLATVGLCATQIRVHPKERSAPANSICINSFAYPKWRARVPEAAFASRLSTRFDRPLRPDTSGPSTLYSRPGRVLCSRNALRSLAPELSGSTLRIGWKNNVISRKDADFAPRVHWGERIRALSSARILSLNALPDHKRTAGVA